MEISILDNIHTRIQSTESVSTLMSAFMVDLRQVNKVIYVKQHLNGPIKNTHLHGLFKHTTDVCGIK